MGMGIDMRVWPKMQKRSDEEKVCIHKKSGIITDSRERDSQGQWTPEDVHHTVFYRWTGLSAVLMKLCVERDSKISCVEVE